MASDSVLAYDEYPDMNWSRIALKLPLAFLYNISSIF